MPSHIVSIWSNIVSIMNSFYAFSPTSTQISTWVIKPISSTFVNVNSLSGYGLTKLILFFNSAQCLSFIPYFLRATNNGTLGLNSSIYDLIDYAIFNTPYNSFSLKNRHTPVKIRIASSTHFSAATASIVGNSSFIQDSKFVNHWLVVTHKLL